MVLSLVFAAALGWSAVTPDNLLGGRPASAGYLQGKVILIDCRDYACLKDIPPDLETLWKAYKSKPFVLVGSHLGARGEEAKAALAEAHVSYPVYAGAAVEGQKPPEAGVMTVIDAAGRTVVRTRDLHRAEEALVSAIAAEAAPSSAAAYRRYVDYELSVLPGKAYNRLKEFRQRFPSAATAYDEAWDRLELREEVTRLAKLERLTRQVKDMDERRAMKVDRALVERIIAAYEDLKTSADPLVVQETKNCIAELKWAAATMKE